MRTAAAVGGELGTAAAVLDAFVAEVAASAEARADAVALVASVEEELGLAGGGGRRLGLF